jgi:hypothetical protein
MLPWLMTALVFLGAILVLALSLGGCSSSTDPQGDPTPQVSIDFLPPSEGQILRLSETMDFAAITDPPARLTAVWYLDGLVVSQDTAFTYAPASVGRHLLEVGAVAGAVRDTFHWYVEVQPDISLLPPEVLGVTIEAGPLPGMVRVSWTRALMTHFPLEEYLVAFSYVGPVTEENWDQATILGQYEYDPDNVLINQLYDADDGMTPGEYAWFAVRVRDDHHQLSPLTQSPRHEITWAWYLGGLVTDDAGVPLPVVGVSTGDYESNTDGRGLFLFDQPFRSIDSVRIATSSSSWFNFTTPPIVAEQETTQADITLINRYDLANQECWTGSFLDYLRDMTRNLTVPGQPTESQLFTWDQYPISVFIPPGQLSQAGIDMEAACLAAMDFWNTTMSDDAQVLGIEESPYFERTTDQAGADIVFLFEYRNLNYGEANLEIPVGEQMGEVIPEKMQIWINTTANLGEFEEVQGVALHEFGHTLGLINHADCSGPEYLMLVGGGTASMRRAEPIHLDERRAVRAIRNIPQGANLASFTSSTSGAIGLTER